MIHCTMKYKTSVQKGFNLLHCLFCFCALKVVDNYKGTLSNRIFIFYHKVIGPYIMSTYRNVSLWSQVNLFTDGTIYSS